MKKSFLVFACLVMILRISAQDLPSIPANGFAFPLGTKFTIKLIPKDAKTFDYSVIEFERFDKTVDTFEHNDLFNKNGNDSTITFYFCVGTNGDTEEEKMKNRQVLLLSKNYTKYSLKYVSEIQRTENGEFEPTSNLGLFPGVMGNEMWPYMIYTIGLRDFKSNK